MFKLKSNDVILDMGFIKKDGDYVYQKNIQGTLRTLFKIYRGSPYIRHSRTSYVEAEQLRLIHEWTKHDYIEWEND